MSDLVERLGKGRVAYTSAAGPIHEGADSLHAEAAALLAAEQRVRDAIVCDVAEMKLTDGRSDFYTRITVGDRSITPYVFRERWKAEYEAATLRWLFCGGEEPDVCKFDPALAAAIRKGDATA